MFRSVSSLLMNPGVYSPEDMTKADDQIKSDTSRDMHGSCDRHSLSEVSMQSIVEFYVPSVKGADPLDCNANISEPQTKDVTNGNSDVVEEEKTYQKRKRLKFTQSSDQPTNDPDITKEESATPFCYQSISGKGVTAEDKVSVEVVDTNKLLENELDCGLGLHGTSPNNDDKAAMEKSNENKSQICDAIVLKEAPSEIENNELPRADSCDACNNDEATKNVCNVDLPELEEESICNFLRADSGKPEEESVVSDTDISLKDVASEVVNECANVAVERVFAGYTRKKLLVLDVNGLLVDICPFVPYDFDPDDIIMKKAVFKRPYCDDFLRFCFEKFDVGVWTSRTKWNIVPIIDFLLGNNKSKLLFCWDQSHCTNTGFCTVEKRERPLLLKKLKKLWDKCEADLPWERGAYNETNTLLLDDTPSKALCNPRYNAIFPFSYQFRRMGDKSLGPTGDLRLYLEGLVMAENVQEYVRQNPFGQRAITETNLSWRYYLRVIEADSRRKN